MSNTPYKSSLSRQALKNCAANDVIPIEKLIHKNVKNCGIKRSKISDFWGRINKYLAYLKTQHKEEPQRNDGLKDKVLKKIFPSNQVGEVIQGNEDLTIEDKLKNTRVIIEYKSLNNHHGMMTFSNLNRVGIAELVEYYMAERYGCYISHSSLQSIGSKKYKNKKAITGIVTNGYRWFIISNASLEKYFGKSALMKKYESWCNGDNLSDAGHDNSYFLQTYVSPAIDKALQHGMQIGYFDLKDNAKKTNSNKFSNKQKQFFQFLSPQELLQENLYIAPNQLTRKFYNELLYIIGLETNKNSKNKTMHRIGANLNNKEDKYKKRYKYRATLIEQICNFNSNIKFDDAVNIAMSFINRILFLKLVEQQLKNFNPDHAKQYEFMRYDQDHIRNFNDINALFFKVMNNRPSERRPLSLKIKYRNIPYLNSSLFEPTNVENKYNIDPSDLDNSLELPLYKTSTLHKFEPRSVKKLPVLEYLLDFLSHYKFDANSHSVATGRSNKNKGHVINAAILGMVFEKINGYQQGSYFTPDYIAAHMAKKSINDVLAKKFKKIGINITDPSELITNYERNVEDAINENNNSISKKVIVKRYQDKIESILDSIKIIDPAVGSAHFLVAALNYLLYLKFSFHILIRQNSNDTEQQQNIKESTKANLDIHYRLKFDNNGQLWLINDFDYIFKYHRNDPKSKNIQKVFFKAKQFIIEHNLYGVDINSNSVNIAKLRLWIELLKDAYYDKQGHMITMPNLESNIKSGNSLISYIMDNKRKSFSIKNLKHIKVSLKDLKTLIQEYHQQTHKKRESICSLQIKDSINRMALYTNINILLSTQQKYNQKNLFNVSKHSAKLNNLLNQIDFYTKILYSHRVTKWTLKLDLILIEMIKHEIFKITNYNTFEWECEFPELLSISKNKVDFKGFDLVITNPPYIPSKLIPSIDSKFFSNYYKFTKYQMDSFELFIELSLKLTNHGYVSMIIPNTFLSIAGYRNVRDYLLRHTGNMSILNSKDRIFPEAAVDNCIILFSNQAPTSVKAYQLENHEFSYIGKTNPKNLLGNSSINVEIFGHPMILSILNTMEKNSKPIVTQKLKANGRYESININYGSVKDGVKLYEGGKGSHPRQPKNVYKNGHLVDARFNRFKDNDPYVKKNPSNNTKFNKRFLGKNTMYRYGFNWDKKYVEYGNKLAAKRDINIFNGPKLLVSKVLRNHHVHTLKVAYTSKQYICAQGIEIIHPRGINPLVMMAILNSKALGFYIIAKLGLLQRNTFPQIQLRHIKGLRIPDLSKVDKVKLYNDVQIILNPKKVAQHIKVNDDIDKVVAKAFKLSDRQQRYLKKFSIK